MTIYIIYYGALIVLPFILPVLMPNWKLLGILFLAAGSFLLYQILQTDRLIAQTTDHGWSDVGESFPYIAAFFFGWGVITRIFTLILKAYSWKFRYRFGITVLLFFAPIIFIVGSLTYPSWQNRTPELACLGNLHKVEFPEDTFQIPVLRFINIYTGEIDRQVHFYFHSNKLRRAFCEHTQNGDQAIKATLVWFNFEKFGRTKENCEDQNLSLGWVERVCHWLYDKKHYVSMSSTPIPNEIFLFQPDKVKYIGFGGSKSTYKDSFLPKTPSTVKTLYVRNQSTLTPDNNPLTAACYDGKSDFLLCKVAYPLSSNLTVMYEFRAKREDIMKKSKIVGMWTYEFIQDLK